MQLMSQDAVPLVPLYHWYIGPLVQHVLSNQNLFLRPKTCFLGPKTCLLGPKTCFVRPKTCFLGPKTCFVRPKICFLGLKTSFQEGKTGQGFCRRQDFDGNHFIAALNTLPFCMCTFGSFYGKKIKLIWVISYCGYIQFSSWENIGHGRIYI